MVSVMAGRMLTSELTGIYLRRNCKSSRDKTVYQIIILRLGPKSCSRIFFLNQGDDVVISY